MGETRELTMDVQDLLGRAMDASHDAIDTWGLEPERRMVHEELNELGLTFAHHARGKATDEEVLDEAADAVLVAVHAAYIAGFTPVGLHRAIERKLRRTEQRIQEAQDDA